MRAHFAADVSNHSEGQCRSTGLALQTAQQNAISPKSGSNARPTPRGVDDEQKRHPPLLRNYVALDR
jgi:hypothetical protein